MKLSRVLSTSADADDDDAVGPPQHELHGKEKGRARPHVVAKKRPSNKPAAALTAASSTMVKLRAAKREKRRRKLSPKQMQRWLEKEADNSQIYNLTLDVNDLKQQVAHYAIQRSVVDTRMLVAQYNFSGAAMRTVDHFFEIFYDGSRDIRPEQQNFLLASTDEILSLGTAAYGRHHLFEQWERYTKLFHMRAFVNASMVVMSNDPECTIVRCDGKFDGRISRETIEVVFPHILDAEELIQRVIGCKIRVPVQTLLYFDPAGKIVRYDAHVGVLQGLNELLASNPKDVVTMMANALINDASMIPDAPVVGRASCPSPTSPTSRFFPVEGDDDRHSLDYILS
ncbi:hypothetical protein Gpo141_00001865 [Globisporangium polare]